MLLKLLCTSGLIGVVISLGAALQAIYLGSAKDIAEFE